MSWTEVLEADPTSWLLEDDDPAVRAATLVRLLGRLERTLPEPAYNLFLYTGPNRSADPKRWRTLAEDFHWHIQILPRLGSEGGFELGSGFYANTVAPEQAAWKTIPSWYIVAQDDKAINPEAERFYAKRMNARVTEIKSSHVPFLSHPREVARVIEQAVATAVAVK